MYVYQCVCVDVHVHVCTCVDEQACVGGGQKLRFSLSTLIY